MKPKNNASRRELDRYAKGFWLTHGEKEDLQLLGRALRMKWDIKPKTMNAGLDIVHKIITASKATKEIDRPTNMERLTAIRILVLANAQNMEYEKRESEIPETVVNINMPFVDKLAGAYEKFEAHQAKIKAIEEAEKTRED